MSLLWIEGFEKYGASGTNIGSIDTNWSVLSFKYLEKDAYDLDMVDGRFGSVALSLDSSSSYLQTPDLATDDDTLLIGFAFKVPSVSAGTRLCDFRTPGNGGAAVTSRSFAIRLNATREISAVKGGTTIAISTTANIQDDTWYYLEVKVKAGGSGVGNVTMHLDGVEIVNYTGNTYYVNNWAYNRILWYRSTGDTVHIDDVYICDSTGVTNNDFLGDCRVESLSPASDVSGNFTANTGSDLYAMVDAIKLNDDYIYDDTTGNQAIFEMGNISANAATGDIQGLMVSCDSQQISSSNQGRFNKHAKLVTQNGSGGSLQDSGIFVPGQDHPITYTQVMELDPDGSSWIPGTVNDVRIGVEVS